MHLTKSYNIGPWIDLSRGGGGKCGTHRVHMALNLSSFFGNIFFKAKEEVIHQAMNGDGVCRAAPSII